MVNTDSSGEREQMEAFLQELCSLALRLKQLSAEHVGTEMTAPTARAILRLLDKRGPQTVPQLARNRSTSRQNIQVIVNRLLKDGYVQVKDNPEHKRSGLVYINAAGLDFLASSTDPWDKTVEQLADRTSGQAVTDASMLLKQLREILQEMRGHRPRHVETPNVEPVAKTVYKARVEPDNELPVTLL